MKLTAAIASAILAATAAASPLAQRVQARNAARAHGHHPHAPSPNKRLDSPVTNGTSKAQSSGNWAGAVVEGEGWTTVSGSVTAPTPKLPPGADSSSQYCATAWVGIDGDSCQTSLLQTGVDFCVTGGQPDFSAWYEWIPAASTDFPDFSFNAGDTIDMSVTATGKKSGKATLTNTNTGQTVHHTFSPDEVQSSLCQKDAEWILEDFSIIEGGQTSLAPFADFGTVTFTNTKAVSGGQTSSAAGGQTIDMVSQSGQTMAAASIDGNNVNVKWESSPVS